jgi:hypothetical protein
MTETNKGQQLFSEFVQLVSPSDRTVLNRVALVGPLVRAPSESRGGAASGNTVTRLLELYHIRSKDIITAGR